ncbi:hypothetical protein HanRHA438_Chr16g0735451 [Helianthus annuus]|nr:hypothetical protein HanRHA438_Chr16g0735451 [Helianthus annuus]
MQWREMGPKDKVKDDGPPKDAYVANALYTRLCGHPFECTVIPEGTSVMAGMSLLWRDIKLYPSFRRDDEGEWSLFDFVDPRRHAALKTADRVIGEQEPDVLKIHLEQVLLPAVPADPAAYVSQPSPSGGSSVSAVETKKTIRVRVTGRKYMATGAATSSVTSGVSVPAGSVAVTAAELASPTHVSKKRKSCPALTAFEAIQAAYVMPIGSTTGVQVEGVSSAPLISVEVTPSARGEPSLSTLISQASATAAVSFPMPPPMPTTAVVVTTSPVSTPLPSSVTPISLFDSPFSVFFCN